MTTGTSKPRSITDGVANSPYGAKPWLAHYDYWTPAHVNYPRRPLYEILRMTAVTMPDQIATAFLGAHLTYGQIKEQSDKLATALARLGLKQNDRVGIMLPNCPQYLVATFAILRLGAIVVNVNPLYTPREVAVVAKDSGMRMLFALDLLAPVIFAARDQTSVETVIVSSLAEYSSAATPCSSIESTLKLTDLLAGVADPDLPHVEIDPEDVAVLQYTGGTTGVPKGAMLTHRNIFANVLQVSLWSNHESRSGSDTFLLVIPFFHIYGFTVGMMAGTWIGVQQVLIPKYDVEALLQAIKDYRPTYFPAVPTIYISLLSHPKVREYGLDKVRAFNSGSAPLPVEVIAQFERLTGGVTLSEGYGLSEASPVTHSTASLARRKPGSIGLPLSDTDIKIVDLDTGAQVVPIGEEGELCIAGPQVMKGYWNRPDETVIALRPDDAGRIWLYTGDVARMDEDGYFYIVQRKKDMIIVSGFNVYPSEVESVLYAHPAVMEAAVIGVPDRYRGEVVKACVVLKGGATASTEELTKHCASGLAEFKVPRTIEIRESLPKTAVGKILHRVLREEGAAYRAYPTYRTYTTMLTQPPLGHSIGGPMGYSINRVVVIGSGTMGGGIAAHVANAGIPVYLLDIAPTALTPEEEKRGLKLDSSQVRNRIVAASLERLKKSKPPAFFSPATADLITIGNLEDHFEWVTEGDWIVEAIVEQLTPKRDLVARIEKARKPKSIISSNTSGLPIAAIAAEAGADFKSHFLGTHFFNPPRYMKLLEVIPTEETLPAIVEFMTGFAERRLGKGVVICKDTPNFIANRFGSISGAMAVAYVMDNKYTIEEADAILSPLIGRPKTGLFRLQDLVGLDVSSSVGENLYGLIAHDETREVLRNQNLGTLRQTQMERGRLGDKTGQGFYKKPPKGKKSDILTLDLETMEYRERREPDIPSIKEAMKIKPLGKRLAFVLSQDDKAGELARHTVYNSLGYAAQRIPEITDQIINVDKALRWGYSHELGPFEMWDLLGVRKTSEAMKKNGVAVAAWVKDMLAAGNETFYRSDNGRLSYYHPAGKTYVTETADDRKLELRALKATGRVVRENKGASLIDIGDGVVCLEFHTKMNTLDDDIKNMLLEAVEEIETKDWRGMVIGNEGADFCVGANLAGGLGTGGLAAIERAVKGMQDALMAVHFCSKPVVTAPFGRTLGGGAEVAMAGARIVAAAETYMGLVEVGVGLLPGAGGCKEMVRRVVSPVMQMANADPLPFLQQALETIAMAKVSSSAAEARSLGFLTEADQIVMNRGHQIADAKLLVLELAEVGYRAPGRAKTCYAAGLGALAALRAGLYVMQQGGYMSEYDLHVSGKVAHILCGGKLSSAQWVDEQYFLDLEREAFVSLCGEQKTIERITHMLTTGKPLRN